jgi:hypothetical protein
MEVKAKTRSPLVAVVLLATLLAGAACDRRGVGAWVAPAGRSHASGERPRVEVLVYRAQGCGYDSSDYRADRVAVGTRRVLTAALRRLLHRLRRPGDPSASDLLRRVSVEDGLAVVDFRPFGDTSLGWASTSCGGAAFWGMLNRTVFQFGSVRAVRYEMGGSCADFHEFVQSACVDGLGVLTRAEWEHGARDS